MQSPIILVGLPRSGSTLVSRIINDSLNCFIVNDFYYLQYVESVNGFNQSNAHIKELLADFIFNQLQNRTQPEDLEDEVWFGLPFTGAKLKDLQNFIAAYKADGKTKNWAQVLQDIMQFAAELAGKPIWGYNTPQDYLNFNRIHGEFPEAKFIFLIRSPLSTLLSYKYYWTVLPKFRHDRGRYHPVIQSLAWKTCVKTYFDLKQEYGQNHCMLIKFEDVLGDTGQVLEKMNRFAGIEFPDIDLNSFGHNSSLSKGQGERQTKKISGLEVKICNLLTQAEQKKLNYGGPSEQKVVFSDFFNLLMITFRNSVYYSHQIVFSRNIRQRVFKFVNQLTLQTGK